MRSGKNSCFGEACHKKIIVSVDAVIGVELLATTLAGKHMANVLPHFVLARHLQILESFITDIKGVNHTSEIRNRRREGCLLMLPLSVKMESLRLHIMVS